MKAEDPNIKLSINGDGKWKVTERQFGMSTGEYFWGDGVVFDSESDARARFNFLLAKAAADVLRREGPDWETVESIHRDGHDS